MTGRLDRLRAWHAAKAAYGVIATIWLVGLTSPATAQISAALAQKAMEADEIVATVQRDGHVRVNVLFESPVPPAEIKPEPASIANIKAKVTATQNAIIAAHFGGTSDPAPGQGFDRGLTRFEITPGFAISVTLAEVEALAADPRVQYINLDRARPSTLLQSVDLIGMPNAYAAGATGQGFAVAVLDTGTQSDHEFLNGKVIAQACFSNGGGGAGRVSLCPGGGNSQIGGNAAQPIGQCLDGASNLCFHGTHVAGIAAGLNTTQSAGEPTNGVATNGSIFAVQVFTRFNLAGDCGGPAPCVLAWDSDLVLGLDHVFANLNLAGGVKVASVNMSLGGGSFAGTCDGAAQKPAIDNLRAAGVLTAIASGNNGFRSAIGSPGCISTAVTVGSTTKTDVISSFSNMSSVVDVMAPGGVGGGSCAFGANNNDILGPVAASPLSTTSYSCLAGTSMATPHVAGAIAAIRTVCPNATVDQILNALISTGIPIADTRSGGAVTKNRIRVDLAIHQLGCGSSGWTVTLSASNTTVPVGTTVTPTATANQDVGSTPYFILIFDGATIIRTCGTGTTCSVSVSSSTATTKTYVAKVALSDGSNVQATSASVSVTWTQNATTPLYRFFNVVTSTHFYTTSEAEKNDVIAHLPQFHFEGIAYYVLGSPAPQASPVYRFFNVVTSTHFYTTSEAEKNDVIAHLRQFHFEGIAFYAYPGVVSGSSPVYRFFNVVTSTHFYTTSEAEKNDVIAHLPQFHFEGVAYFAYVTP